MYAALIPARSGSVRIKNKNIKLLAGVSLIEWTIRAARKAGIFDAIAVSTDSEEIGRIAIKCGVKYIKRPSKCATDKSPDIEWIRHALKDPDVRKCDTYMILRPTNPFRRAKTIFDAMWVFDKKPDADSLRAVRIAMETPYKMWVIEDSGYMRPFWQRAEDEGIATPYDWQTSALPDVYIQSGCIQIFNRKTWIRYGNQTGVMVLPYFTPRADAFDINTEADLREAESMAMHIKPEEP